MKIYKFIKIYVLILLLIASGTMSFAQEVSGLIKNSKNKELIGYVIRNNATGQEIKTGKRGNFTINASANDVLDVLLNGIKVSELEVKGENAVYFLHENPFVKSVDGAYGKVNRSTSSSAMDILTADKIESTSYTNTHHVTIGQLAGLTTTMNNGEPGSNGLSFRIRGNNTFGTNTPLVLVDGFESSFAHLSNFEIETITVLKDAVATAMYGMRASNGVILVTTKKGYVGQTSMKVNADFGTLMPTNLPDYVDAYTYSSLANQAHANDGLAPRYSQSELDGYQLDNDPYNYPNVDWQEEMLKSATDYMNTSVEFRGGSERVQYYSMIAYMYANGLFKHTDENPQYSSANKFNRINFRTNADIALTNNFDLNIGIGGRLESRNDPQSGTAGLMYNIQNSPANRYVMYNENGTYGGSSQYRANPMGEMVGKGYTDAHSRYINFNMRLNYAMDFIAKGLSASAEVAFNNAFTGTERFNASYRVYDRVLNTLPDGTTELNYVPYGTETTITYNGRSTVQDRTETFRAYLAYDRTFGNHAINALFLYDQNKQVYQNQAEAYKYNGWSLRANYGYQNKYFLDLVGSYNGSNAYNPEKQYGFFPALGASWIVSNEDFLNSNKLVDYLKLRSSYGITGNSEGVPRFTYLPNYSGDGSYRFGKTAGVSIGGLSEKSIVNPDYQWSKNYQLNIGFDAVLLNKVNLSFDYFKQNTTDILQSINPEVTEMVGIAVPQFNYGEVKNTGFETALGYSDNMTNGISWYVEGNVGFATNEITKAYEVGNNPTSMVGESLGAIYGYLADGFYQNPADIAASPVNTLHPVQPGDVKYKNIAGSGVIDEHDRTVLGNAIPELHYGINLGAEIKGVYVSASLDGLQRDVMMNYHSVYRPLGSGYSNISEYAANNHWTPDRGNSARLPRLSVSDNYNNYVASSLYLQDGSFFRLRSAEIGYKFNKSILQKIRIAGAKVYVRGHNLAVLHSIEGDVDPEVMGGHPLLKSYNIGLNVQF
ncbi:SusC/RagA family TonB-linked outer membrane protein [Carboxylicivirga marina]|uniref:SusC/RagA family TonB-linked outer membrane protein n=1 Tax=Carboxylicivirga marina TaxID=2800988 RepID=A0ABS1HLD6_9BACT|nr:SusC/RagA family TonB-linked outer membrane protein [Carboxylicivirga marina]MBK3518280.1 SusC/RagA family TonB-linked outer membrane protein [Carboxylicivirga marina]